MSKGLDSLDLPNEEFAKLLDKSAKMVLRQFEKAKNQPGYRNTPQASLQEWFDEPIPEEGLDAEALLNQVESRVLDTATGNLGPNMYGYVVSGGTQIGIIAEQLAATINQNVAKWHLAPAITEIEKRVVSWTADALGYDPAAGGILGSGGSGANLTALTIARNIFFEKEGIRSKGLFGMKPFIVYCSTETHNCIDKSVEMLGIGTDQLRKIETNSDLTINLESLKSQLEADVASGIKPFCIVGNAGTVNTGAIDDLEALARLCKEYGCWFHVDGAYGGLASTLKEKRPMYKGMEKADSIALDFHKWFYVPFEAGCTLVRSWDQMRRTYFTKASYLDNRFEQEGGRIEFNEHNFQLSRNARALKVWMTIKAYGMNAIKSMIQKDIELARYLSDQVNDASDFELVADSDLAISCFKYVGDLKDQNQIRELNQRLIPTLEADGRVFITSTRIDDEVVLRACLINHRKNQATTDYLLEVIREVAQTL